MKRARKIVTLLVFFFSINNIVAQDWANFIQFKKANTKLSKVKKNKKRIVFMGNSITIGWLETNPEFFESKAYINRGISGQTTPQMLVRFRADVVDIQADAVIILAGTNDIAENTGPVTLKMILNNLKSMTEIAKANNIKVVLCSVLPAYEYPWSPNKKPNIKIPKLNNMIKDYAEKSQTYYLDYFSALENGNNGLKTDYTNDGVHLTAKGYSIMESILEDVIKEIFE